MLLAPFEGFFYIHMHILREQDLSFALLPFSFLALFRNDFQPPTLSLVEFS